MNAKTNAPQAKVSFAYVISIAVTYMFMIGTVAVSFSHIISVSETLGLAWEAWTVPFLVDGMAILGLVGRCPRFPVGTRRAGLVLVGTGGALSLTCNVLAGHNVGQRAYGVLIVGGFMLTEWYAGRLRPPSTQAEDLHTKRSEAARKAAVTRKANAEARTAKPTRKPRAPRAVKVKDLEAAYAMPSAPVSPAP